MANKKCWCCGEIIQFAGMDQACECEFIQFFGDKTLRCIEHDKVKFEDGSIWLDVTSEEDDSPFYADRTLEPVNCKAQIMGGHPANYHYLKETRTNDC
jgi:hypothetical protein